MDNIVDITNSAEGLSIWHLILNASLIVQLVMVILLLASIISWTMIFYKWGVFKKLQRSSNLFESEFWSGGDMASLYRNWNIKKGRKRGMANLYLAGYQEYTRLDANKDIDG